MIRFFSKIAGPVFYSRESALVFLFFHEFAGPASFIQLVFLFERKEYLPLRHKFWVCFTSKYVMR